MVDKIIHIKNDTELARNLYFTIYYKFHKNIGWGCYVIITQ